MTPLSEKNRKSKPWNECTDHTFFFWSRFDEKRSRIESHTREITPRWSLAEFEKTTISIFNAAAPSVVYIFTENAVTGFFGTRQVRQGAGSGFLWDRNGHVVTYFHA